VKTSQLIILAFAIQTILAGPAYTQRIDVTDVTNPAPEMETEEGENEIPPPPTTGKKAAQKYMGISARETANEPGYERRPNSFGPSDTHYLAIHAGAYVSDDAYRWGGTDRATDVGTWNAGVTYRVGEWVNSMDLCFRMDFSAFDLPAGKATKISVLPVILFPDANSRFPLYFGGGLGAGIMTKQLNDESVLTLDYQLLLGTRFFDVFGSTGFFVEAGVKNHINLLSDGQFNGTFISAGTVFTF
jgi:hypothetical protein